MKEVLKTLLGLSVITSIFAMYYTMALYPIVILFVGGIPVVCLIGFISHYVGNMIWNLIKK